MEEKVNKVEDSSKFDSTNIIKENVISSTNKPKYNIKSKPVPSNFLLKRISKGQKFFDSGDYNMARAREKLNSLHNLEIKVNNESASSEARDTFAENEDLKVLEEEEMPTGTVIPTPLNVPARKASIFELPSEKAIQITTLNTV